MTDGDQIYQVITANRLDNGAVVYLTKSGKALGWSQTLADAAVFRASVIDRMLRLVQVFVGDNTVVDPYAIEVAHNRRPLSKREQIRAGGPTVTSVRQKPLPPEPDFII